MARDYTVSENVGRPAKYTEQDFKDIVNKVESDGFFARKFNVSEHTIQGIRCNQSKRLGIKTVDRYKKQKYNKQIIDEGNKMNETETQKIGSDDEFEMKIIVDDNLSINCKVQKEMSVDDFEALVMRAKALSKASGYGNVMGIKKSYHKREVRRWDESELLELKKLWGKNTIEELEKEFSRTFIAIRHKATDIGLKIPDSYSKYKVSGNTSGRSDYAKWIEGEEQKLRKLHSEGMSMVDIAEKLGKTRKQCYDKMKNMKTKGVW